MRQKIGLGVVLAAVAAAMGAAILVAIHAQQEVYGIPGWGVAACAVLAAVVVGGAAALLWAGDPALGAVALAVAALVVFGVLAIWSVGLLALIGAAALVVWAGNRQWPGRRSGIAAAAGAVAGAPLPLLVLLALDGPLVSCDPRGASGGENLFMTLGAPDGDSVGFDSATVSPDGEASGESSGPGYSYSYECRDGRLVSFELRWR